MPPQNFIEFLKDHYESSISSIPGRKNTFRLTFQNKESNRPPRSLWDARIGHLGRYLGYLHPKNELYPLPPKAGGEPCHLIVENQKMMIRRGKKKGQKGSPRIRFQATSRNPPNRCFSVLRVLRRRSPSDLGYQLVFLHRWRSISASQRPRNPVSFRLHEVLNYPGATADCNKAFTVNLRNRPGFQWDFHWFLDQFPHLKPDVFNNEPLGRMLVQILAHDTLAPEICAQLFCRKSRVNEKCWDIDVIFQRKIP